MEHNILQRVMIPVREVSDEEGLIENSLLLEKEYILPFEPKNGMGLLDSVDAFPTSISNLAWCVSDNRWHSISIVPADPRSVGKLISLFEKMGYQESSSSKIHLQEAKAIGQGIIVSATMPDPALADLRKKFQQQR